MGDCLFICQKMERRWKPGERLDEDPAKGMPVSRRPLPHPPGRQRSASTRHRSAQGPTAPPGRGNRAAVLPAGHAGSPAVGGARPCASWQTRRAHGKPAPEHSLRSCCAGVAVVDGMDDAVPGSFELGGVAVGEVAFDGGEVAAEAAVGEGSGDPAGEVAAG